MTPFGAILQRAVEATPGAIGGAFAANDGELVDAFIGAGVPAGHPGPPPYDPHDWAVLTAHYGVLLAQVRAWLGTRHFGGPEYFITHHAAVDVVVCVVDASYFALLALRAPGGPLARAMVELRTAVTALHREMV